MNRLTQEQLKKDVTYFQKKLTKMHPNPFKKIKSNVFHEYLDDIKSHSNGMEIQDFGMRLIKLLAMLGDGHNELGYSPDVLGTLSYPFKFKYISDGYYVISATKEFEQYLGSKILGINNKSINEVEKVLQEVIPIENETSLNYYFPSKVVEPDILKYLGITNGNHADFKLQSKGKEVTINVKALDFNVELIDINETIPHLDITLDKKGLYWTKDMPNINTLYLQYNECEIDEDYKMNKVVKEINSFDRKNLVIDLRYNKGGDSDVLNPVLRYIKDKKVRIQVYVLTGSDTYSSAIYNLVQLSRFENVTTIGDIPHGNPTHYGQVESFELPNSELRIYTSTRTFTFKGYKLGESFKPQYIVSNKPDEILNGKDSQFMYLENILK